MSQMRQEGYQEEARRETQAAAQVRVNHRRNEPRRHIEQGANSIAC
jgi:hypothetical protein